MGGFVRSTAMEALEAIRLAKAAKVESGILEYLYYGDHTIAEIGNFVGLQDRATRQHLARLIYEDKVHICGWELIPVAYQYRPILKLGAGAQAPYPREGVESALEREIFAYTAKIEGRTPDDVRRPPITLVAKRDWLVEAFFGKAV